MAAMLSRLMKKHVNARTEFTPRKTNSFKFPISLMSVHVRLAQRPVGIGFDFAHGVEAAVWRMGWDSNPRWA